jgi:hypothetical protein
VGRERRDGTVETATADLRRGRDHLLADSKGGCARVIDRIAHIEHFLANEHREWLRLPLEAEWFL